MTAPSRPPLAPGIEVAARMVPATEVGGDYYDVLPMEDGCWLAIGDASGQGLEAGVVSVRTPRRRTTGAG
jgi:sigma-B regulation protein RsbU (phosphoserine phosphatase)